MPGWKEAGAAKGRLAAGTVRVRRRVSQPGLAANVLVLVPVIRLFTGHSGGSGRPPICPLDFLLCSAVTYLAPCPGELPGKYLLAGSFKLYLD